MSAPEFFLMAVSVALPVAGFSYLFARQPGLAFWCFALGLMLNLVIISLAT